MPSAVATFLKHVQQINCTRHLIDNISAAKLGPFERKDIWSLQKAFPASTFENQWLLLSLKNSKVTNYLAEIPKEKWALHAIHAAGLSLFGHRTSNRVESENHRLLPARSDAPYGFIEATARLQMDILRTQKKTAQRYVTANMTLAKKAEVLYEKQSRLSQACHTQVASDNIVYVTYTPSASQTRWTVDLSLQYCSCSRWQQFKIPCHHAIAAAREVGLLNNMAEWYAKCMAPCYLTKSYLAGYADAQVLLPLLEELIPDGITKPAARVVQAGRPRKRRIRSAGGAAGDGQQLRKRHKCGICGGSHHRQTCPSA
jgi:hypothetical protein